MIEGRAGIADWSGVLLPDAVPVLHGNDCLTADSFDLSAAQSNTGRALTEAVGIDTEDLPLEARAS